MLYIAIGADGAPFGRDDTATGNYNYIATISYIKVFVHCCYVII